MKRAVQNFMNACSGKNILINSHSFFIMSQSIERALMPWTAVLTGLFLFPAINAFRIDAQIRAEIMTYASLPGIVGLILWWKLRDLPNIQCEFWFLNFCVGILLFFLLYRYVMPFFDLVKSKLTRKSKITRQGRTDVRRLSDKLPRTQKEYDPRQYYCTDSYFLGKDEEGRAIYWKERLPHLAIVGTSGCGKGRKLQDLSAQSVAMGEALIYLDPKNDEWGPHALYSACQTASKEYCYVNLMPQSPAQFNLLDGAIGWEIEELFSAVFDLGDKGKGSDFYAAKNRAAAREAANLATSGKLTIAGVYQAMCNDDFWNEEAPGFLDKLRELAELPAINAKETTFSLNTFVEHGGGLYVVGSMTLQAVRRAQQMIFVRVQQIASARDRMAGPLKTVCVIADEAKYHISRPILQGLGASRDKGMRVVLAFQSFLDLRDCPSDMNPDAVVGAVIENTPCKLVYRLEDPETAQWLAKRSGIVLVDDESRILDRNTALAEASNDSRAITQGTDFLIDTNMLQNLPSGWAIIFGHGLARPCFISPYRVKKCLEAITSVYGVSPFEPARRSFQLDGVRGEDFFDLEA